jgi:2'-5' RNA ligase
VRQAMITSMDRKGVAESTPWVPHVTLAYSTAIQPAGPLIAALGNELPPCEVTVDSINLIAQNGPERLWDWQSIAEVGLG